MSKFVTILTSPLSLIDKKVGAIVSGAFLVVAGIISGQPGVVLAGVARIAGALAKTKARVSQGTSMQIGEVPRGGVFGKAAVAGSLVDAFNFGGKRGTDWTCYVIDLADHRCEALVEFFVNDDKVTFTGDGFVAGYDEKLRVSWRPGAEDDDVPDWVLANAPLYPAGHPLAGQPTWTADDRGRGVCKVYLAYMADKPDAKHPVWSGQLPQFLWVLKGALLYSARDDSSVGGDGAHRWDDPATRIWSDNLIDCRYTFVRGLYACDRVDDPSMLMLGRGLSAIEAPPANVFAAANLCDEDVPLKAGGSEKRYRCNGSFTADMPFIDVENDFAAACGGWIVERDGSVELVPGAAQPIVWQVTDEDLVVGSTVKRSDFRSRTDDEWSNSVSVRYIEPKQQWKDHSAPVRRVPADIIADGGVREVSPQLMFCTSGTQAQRVGEQVRRTGRLWRTRELVLPPRLIGIEHGDWIEWTSARYGAKARDGALLNEDGGAILAEDGGAILADPTVPIVFMVQRDSQNERWWNALAIREMTPECFDWNAAIDELEDKSEAVGQTPPESGDAPEGGSWALEAAVETGDGGTTSALVFTGANDDPDVEAIIFEYAASSAAPDAGDDGAWTIGNVGTGTTTRAEVAGVMPGTTYWGAVSYRIARSRGDRLILGPATTASGTGGEGRIASEDGGRVLGEDGSQIIKE